MWLCAEVRSGKKSRTVIQISMKFPVRLHYPVTMKTKLLQIVHFILTNLLVTWWSPLHWEDAPLAEEQGYPTFQCQHLQRWGRHTWAFWAFGGNRDSGACGGLCGVCARQEVGKSCGAEERISSTLRNGKALFSLLCLQTMGLSLKALLYFSLLYLVWGNLAVEFKAPLCLWVCTLSGKSET